MRSIEEVLKRFQELRAKMLRARKEKFLAKNFSNCSHNIILPVKGVGKVGLCQNPVLLARRGRPLVCNDDEFARRCDCFNCIYTEELVERDFDTILSSPSRCGEEYPKLAILIWFLQDDSRCQETRWQKLLGHLRQAFKAMTNRRLN